MTATNGCQGFKQYKISILITHRLCLIGRIMRHHRNLPFYSAYRFYTFYTCASKQSLIDFHYLCRLVAGWSTCQARGPTYSALGTSPLSRSGSWWSSCPCAPAPAAPPVRMGSHSRSQQGSRQVWISYCFSPESLDLKHLCIKSNTFLTGKCSLTYWFVLFYTCHFLCKINFWWTCKLLIV